MTTNFKNCLYLNPPHPSHTLRSSILGLTLTFQRGVGVNIMKIFFQNCTIMEIIAGGIPSNLICTCFLLFLLRSLLFSTEVLHLFWDKFINIMLSMPSHILRRMTHALCGGIMWNYVDLRGDSTMSLSGRPL